MSEVEICRLAYEGDFVKVRELIENDKSLLTQKDESGRIPIHWAASGSRTDIINFLLQQGSPVDSPDDIPGHVGIFGNEQANIAPKTATAEPECMTIPFQDFNIPVSSHVYKKIAVGMGQSNWTPLMIASSIGRSDIVKALISRGADVNVRNLTGLNSPLHYAASKSKVEVAELLLDNHANINASDHMGSTPLHRAAAKGNIKIVKLFLENYSNQLELNPTDSIGNTPLHLACEEERVEVAKLLIEAGARVDILNKEKQTAIDLAPGNLRRILRSLESCSDRIYS